MDPSHTTHVLSFHSSLGFLFLIPHPPHYSFSRSVPSLLVQWLPSLVVAVRWFSPFSHAFLLSLCGGSLPLTVASPFSHDLSQSRSYSLCDSDTSATVHLSDRSFFLIDLQDLQVAFTFFFSIDLQRKAPFPELRSTPSTSCFFSIEDPSPEARSTPTCYCFHTD